MEELVLIISILASILSVVVSFMKKKKKEQKLARQEDAAYHPRGSMASSHSQTRSVSAPKPAAPAYTHARMSGEGVDDCHAYMLDEISPASSADERTAEEKQQAANDLLRGVILSEILQRPRPIYGRKQA